MKPDLYSVIYSCGCVRRSTATKDFLRSPEVFSGLSVVAKAHDHAPSQLVALVPIPWTEETQ